MSPTAPTSPTPTLRVDEARRLVADLHTPHALRYWTDLLLCVGIGWAAFVLAIRAPLGSLASGLWLLLATALMYRAGAFTHELAHVKRGRLAGFRWVWNLTCGFPLMIPSFMYRGVHNDHHKQGLYGTAGDGEYLPFVQQGRLRILGYVLFSLVAPVLLFGRLVLLVPLGWLSPRFHDFLWRKASSLQIDMTYERPAQSARDEADWRLQEFMTLLYGGGLLLLSVLGILPWRVALAWYVMEAAITTMNALRTLAAHRYRNAPDHPLDVAAQYLDSVNVPGRWLAPLWAPVGLQFHATHHLLPAIPYHALPEAHRRLCTGLTDPTAYRAAEAHGLWPALGRLWRDASRHTA